MQAKERQQRIVALAREEGQASVERLADAPSESPETIWQDLTLLERQGLLRRVHGGVIPLRGLGFEPDLPTRDEVMEEEKQRIAAAALDEVPDEGVILLDARSTTFRLAELLPGGRELTVITNSLPIAQLLAQHAELTVLTLGGRVRARTLAEVDVIAISTLGLFLIDVSFLATNDVSVEHGLTTPDLAEAEVKRAMCQRAAAGAARRQQQDRERHLLPVRRTPRLRRHGHPIPIWRQRPPWISPRRACASSACDVLLPLAESAPGRWTERSRGPSPEPRTPRGRRCNAVSTHLVILEAPVDKGGRGPRVPNRAMTSSSRAELHSRR
jgi:DeoR family fructose operon transcriptional repressor